MSEPDTLPSHVHPEAALLPWFMNETLGDRERREVAVHLEHCAACRTELDELKSLKTELTASYAAAPEPSPKTARSVLEVVARDAAARRTTRASRESWIEGVDQWLRSLFVPRWIPTLAATILFAQVGLLLWTTMPATQPEQVTSRALDRQIARLRVAFQDAATEEQIRSLLQTVRGRIVDGPNLNGLYIIEVLAADAETRRKKLDMLRGRNAVIRSADLDIP